MLSSYLSCFFFKIVNRNCEFPMKKLIRERVELVRRHTSPQNKYMSTRLTVLSYFPPTQSLQSSNTSKNPGIKVTLLQQTGTEFRRFIYQSINVSDCTPKPLIVSILNGVEISMFDELKRALTFCSPTRSPRLEEHDILFWLTFNINTLMLRLFFAIWLRQSGPKCRE